MYWLTYGRTSTNGLQLLTGQQLNWEVSQTIPRLCGRQMQRTNIPAADPETYYRLAIYIPFLDHLMEGLSDRFGAAQQEMAEKIISLCNDENVRDLATSVVMTLTDSYLDTGRTLSTDNFYTSVPLAEMLLTHKTHLVST